jgi:hypothetical protein
MSKTHNWFATSDDLKLILDWVRNSGATIVGVSAFPNEMPCDGHEVVLHFPTIGPLEFWPDEVRLADYPENSRRWRQAVILRSQTDSKHRNVDADRSAAAGLRVPELRDNRFWVSGSMWFPGSRLRDTFPDLARVCSRFERWLRRFAVVFDNTEGDDKSPYTYQLCMSGIVQRAFALPAAESLLKDGAFMVDHMTSPRCYGDFRRHLELIGKLPLKSG